MIFFSSLDDDNHIKSKSKSILINSMLKDETRKKIN